MVSPFSISLTILSFSGIFIFEASAASCYTCSGLNCAPHHDQLVPCKQKSTLAEVKCFFVAWNKDNIYRGCFEVNGTHVNYCDKHRLNLCVICQGQACNNKPIYQDTRFSCRKCSLGKCHYTDVSPKSTYHTCQPFFYGHVPRCLTYYYYPREQYFFACASEIPTEVRDVCAQDHFFTVCRYCDYPNCNNRFFANFRELKNYRMTCHAFESETFNCFSHMGHTPVMGCYINPKAPEIRGCLSWHSYDDYDLVIQAEHQRLCGHEQECNTVDTADYFNTCLKYFKGNPIIGPCSMRWARCMVTQYQDIAGKLITMRHCETRFECTHRGECIFCDKSSSDSLCNGFPAIADPRVYSCYYCNDVKDCNTMNSATSNRTHFCEDKGRRCFTYLDHRHDRVIRGCYSDSHPHAKKCRKDPGNCEVCTGPHCNGKSTRMYCYVCSARNRQCQYDQLQSGFTMCPGNNTLTEEMGCYSSVSPDKLVERGCWRGNFSCPSLDVECYVCNTTACNDSTYKLEHCIECEGAVNGDCGSNVTYLADDKNTRQCGVYRDVPLCFVAYSKNNTHVQRGCTSNMQYVVWLEPICDRKMWNCSFCHSPNCNYFVLDP